MKAIIKIKSYSDGEMILSEKYTGSYEVKGRYVRLEYENGEKEKTKMTLCPEDSGFYKLDSKGERELVINCSGGDGTALLTIGAHSLEGRIKSFGAKTEISSKGCGVRLEYVLSFSPDMKTKTRLVIEAENEEYNNGQ